MSIPGSAEPLLLAQQDTGGYQIQRSLRFNSSDSAFLSRTPASAGNRKTWTWAAWVKRSGTTTGWLPLFQAYDGSSLAESNFLQLTIYLDQIGIATNTVWLRRTQAVYRDYSAWMHVVCTFDTTQATGADRIKIYVNGSQVTTFSLSNDPSLNGDYGVNRAVPHQIGQRYGGQYFDGYLADIHFIDGQALTPSSFTEVSATTGQLIPKAYTGSYGTNGFHLPFSDNSTAAALGTDTSGNGNDWTVNNFSVDDGSGAVYSATSTMLNPIPVFDGDPNTYGTSAFNSGGYQTVTEAVVVFTSTFSYTTNNFGNNGTRSLRLTRQSDSATTVVTTSSTSSWTIPAGFTGVAISKIEWERTFGSYENVSQVLVDGVPLIDSNGTRTDSLVDTPTSYGTDTGAGSEVRGNYATLNPLHSYVSLASNGNLDCNSNGSGWIGSTIHVTTGKWYVEFTVGATGTIQMFGVCTSTHSGSGYPWQASTPGVTYYAQDGRIYVDGVNTGTTTASTAGDIISLSFDVDAKSVVVRRNNSILSTKTIGTTSSYMFFISDGGGNATSSVNFGQRPFAYTAPSGFKALCDTNLPAPVVAKPNTAFDVALWTGNGSARSITGLNFNPDFVWIKGRSGATDHALYDVVRGTEKRLESNNTDTEVTSDGGVTAFNSDGFSLGTLAQVNTNTATYAGWTWDAGSSTVTNTQGSITSQVRANASAGFSIVTYTGTGANGTVGHGLGVAPGMIIVKARTTAASGDNNWLVYHSGLTNPQQDALLLNSTTGPYTNNTYPWNSSVTSSLFGVSSNSSYGISSASVPYVAYCFAPVAGYSAFGRYTGNGSTDGPFVYTGFRPRWIMFKQTTAASATGWWIYDAVRQEYNSVNRVLFANDISNEGDSSLYAVDLLSNGFKLRSTRSEVNASAGTYIYAAFAESPFQYARAR